MIIHFSIDDVFGSFKYLSLNKNKCTSIFDSIFFSALKDIHEKFDVNFSLYCMYERGGYTLEDFTDCYKEEFMKNSDWISYGYHCYTDNSNYNDATYEQIKKEYQQFRQQILRITGIEKLENNIRLHFFSGNEDVVKGLKSEGIKGLFSADDDRKSYGLEIDKIKKIKKCGSFFDQEIGITYYNTDIRIENIIDKDISRVVADLTCKDRVNIFTHEKYLGNEKIKEKIYEVIREVKKLED